MPSRGSQAAAHCGVEIEPITTRTLPSTRAASHSAGCGDCGRIVSQLSIQCGVSGTWDRPDNAPAARTDGAFLALLCKTSVARRCSNRSTNCRRYCRRWPRHKREPHRGRSSGPGNHRRLSQPRKRPRAGSDRARAVVQHPSLPRAARRRRSRKPRRSGRESERAARRFHGPLAADAGPGPILADPHRQRRRFGIGPIAGGHLFAAHHARPR